MNFFRFFVVLFCTAVVMICFNMFGYGFTNPIELSFDVNSATSTETRVSYKNDYIPEFTEGLSVRYLIAGDPVHPYAYKHVNLKLNNVREVSALKIEFSAANDDSICYRNVRLTNRSNYLPLFFSNSRNDGIQVKDTNNDDFCFTITQSIAENSGFSPYLIMEDFLVKSEIDYYSPWQIVLGIGIFLAIYFMLNIGDRIAEKRKIVRSFDDVVLLSLLISLFTFSTLYVLSEILIANNVHERELILLSIGIIETRFLILIRHFIVKHVHVFESLLLLLVLMLVRYAVFKINVGTIYASEFLGYLHIIKQDFTFDMLAVLLLSLGFYASSKLFKTFIVLVVICGLTIMFSDYIMNTEEQSARLLFSKLMNLKITDFSGNYAETFIRYVHTAQGILTLGLILLVLMIIQSMFKIKISPTKISLIRLFAYTVIFGISAWIYYVNIGTSSVFDDKFYNVVEVNRSIEITDFSRLSATSTESFYPKKGLNSQKNVILLVVDSLSSFKSRLYGGEDYMPKLDIIAQDNIWFPNFYATAYNQEIANIALLTGTPYLHNGSDLDAPAFYKNTVPKELSKYGYKSITMYSAEPTSIERRQYDLAGFDFNVDYENEFYPTSAPRYKAGSVDAKLFLENASRHIEYWRKNNMKFFVQLTSSFSSSPYIVPVDLRKNPTRVEYDLNRVTSFTDEAIAKFVTDLESMKYFDNGILIITGNHRANVSLTKKEFDEDGLIAMTKVPCIIIDKDLSKKNHKYENDLSSLSIPEIIYYLTIDEYNGSSMRVNPFVDKHNDELIIYQKPAPRNVILLKKGNTSGEFHIRGNKSEIVGNLFDKDATFGDLIYLLKDNVYKVEGKEQTNNDDQVIHSTVSD